jgi:hypothetical protein
MPHVPGHVGDDPNLLSKILGWEVPGVPKYPARDIPRVGGFLDALGRIVVPGAETTSMAREGDASAKALSGSLGLDFLPVSPLAARGFRGARGIYRNLFPKTGTQPDTQFIRFGAPPVDRLTGEYLASHNWGALDPKTGIPDISQGNMREAGVSAYQTMQIPQNMLPNMPTEFFDGNWIKNTPYDPNVPWYGVRKVPNPNPQHEASRPGSIQRGWFNIGAEIPADGVDPTKFGYLSNRFPHVISGQPVGQLGADAEPLINPQSISNVSQVPLSNVIPPNPMTENLFKMFDPTGRPMEYKNVTPQSFFNPTGPQILEQGRVAEAMTNLAMTTPGMAKRTSDVLTDVGGQRRGKERASKSQLRPSAYMQELEA